MQAVIAKLAIFIALFSVIATVNATPLDDYVNMPDSSYTYSVGGNFRGFGYTAYAIHMTSQTWLTAADTNQPVWMHWLMVCIPDEVLYNTSLIYMDGGHTSDSEPTSLISFVDILCRSTKAVTAHLQDIPNQPIIFSADPKKKHRSEDAMIAFTWAHFINDTKSPYWLARMPMTKAGVRAMDTIQDFTKNMNIPKITSFAIAGASKRGWTTWTVAAVDKRVTVFIPIVIPILDMVANINKMWEALGEWTFAFGDYLEENVMNYLNTPQFQLMANIIDPIKYLDRYVNKAKYVICATGDEFFLPDGATFFWDKLQGSKYLRMVPNAEHALLGSQTDVALSISSFIHMQLGNKPQPRVSWQLVRSNTTNAQIIVKTQDKPKGVYMWYARTLSATRRDFRLITCINEFPGCAQPVMWWYHQLEDQGNGVYVATQNAPLSGWTGFLVELIYEVPSKDPVNVLHEFKITTEVNIVPDTLPYPSCGDNCQPKTRF
jgi:PhoPQ-activated pathogenicity-related protein